METFVRVFESKKPEKAGRKYFALVVTYGGGRQKLFFDQTMTFCALLNLSPNALVDLPCGDYPIVE